MQLLTPITRISATLAQTTADLARHLASASVLTDRLAADLLALDDDSLAAWMNAQSPQDIEALFTAHATVGHALNTASATIAAVLAASGSPIPIPTIDTRPVAEKLASQRRTLTLTDAGWQVTTEPPEESPTEE